MSIQNSVIAKAGYRLTLPRKTILEAVGETPLTAQQIFQKLGRQKTAPDLATVYRNLELLSHLGLITRVQFEDTVTRYELSGTKHHHHLICEQCGSIEDIPLQEDILLSQVTKQSSFKVKRHLLEFFGICSHCQQ